MNTKFTGEIKFRKAEIDETDCVFSIFSSAVSDLEDRGIFQWDSVYPDRDTIKNDILNKTLYVGTFSDEIIAVFVLSKEFDDAYNFAMWSSDSYIILHRLCIHPKWQNKGIGRKTMAYIEKLLIKNGIGSVRLDAFSKNPYSIKLYESIGYKKVGKANWRKGLFYIYEKCL
jgi:ribosomal protein S18 acetylase RimI-like enzyme